jgi:hypothetical protein
MTVAELEYAPDTSETASPVVESAPKMSVRTERAIVFGACVAIYLTLGAVLVFRYDSIAPDALSRVGNASYVLFSRDPKLAAIGFVWTPLPSLVMLPLLPLKFLWPSLLRLGFTANIESALCMALAATILHRSLEDWGVTRGKRIALVAVFALNPMILYYGANGMSEAMLVLFLVGSTRWLVRWMNDNSTGSLARAGGYLALAYLARYEALAAGVAVTALVGAVAWRRTTGDRADRRHNAIADAALVGMPIASAVGGFALASWVIVGHPFETFSSRYGNSAQIATAARGIAQVHGGTTFGALWYLIRQLGLLAPGLLVAVPVVVFLLSRRRGAVLLAPVAVLGSVLAFQALVFANGSSFGWLRFQITSIPMLVMLAGLAVSTPSERHLDPVIDEVIDADVDEHDDDGDSAHRGRREIPNWRPALIAVVAVGVLTAPLAMRSPVLGREEYAQVLPVVQRVFGAAHPQPGTLHEFATERSIASYLDGLHLPNGSVLADDALAFPIILASKRPRLFVITSDRDFEAAVAYPAANHVRYLLVSPNANGLDALSAQYPDLYDNGAGISRRVGEFDAGSPTARSWRLYEIDGS